MRQQGRARHLADQVGRLHGGGVQTHLLGAGLDDLRGVVERANAGVVQGALLAFTALGAYAEKDKEVQSDLTRLLGGAIHAALNLYQDYIPGKTNPVWMDLSPAAPLENGEGEFQRDLHA